MSLPSFVRVVLKFSILYAQSAISPTPFLSLLNQLPLVSLLKPMPWSTNLSGVTSTRRPATSSQSYFLDTVNWSFSYFQGSPLLCCQGPSGMAGPMPPHLQRCHFLALNRSLIMLIPLSKLRASLNTATVHCAVMQIFYFLAKFADFSTK